MINEEKKKEKIRNLESEIKKLKEFIMLDDNGDYVLKPEYQDIIYSDYCLKSWTNKLKRCEKQLNKLLEKKKYVYVVKRRKHNELVGTLEDVIIEKVFLSKQKAIDFCNKCNVSDEDNGFYEAAEYEKVEIE